MVEMWCCFHCIFLKMHINRGFQHEIKIWTMDVKRSLMKKWFKLWFLRTAVRMIIIVLAVEYISNHISKRSRSRRGMLISNLLLDMSLLLMIKDLSEFLLSHLRRKFGFLLIVKVLLNTWLTGTMILLAWIFSKSWKNFLGHIKFTCNGYPRMLTSQVMKLLTAFAKAVACEAMIPPLFLTFSGLFSIVKFKNKYDRLTPLSHS